MEINTAGGRHTRLLYLLRWKDDVEVEG